MSIKKIYTPEAPEPIGPYSQAIKAGGFLYLSGQISIDPKSGNVVHTQDIKAETKQVLENIKAVLIAAEADWKQVVKVSIFLKNMDDFQAVNEVYATYFDDIQPAREAVEVAKLPKGVNVEMSLVAFLG